MIDKKLKKEIKLRIELLERPGNRVALSTRYPLLKSPILFTRRFIQNWKNFFNSAIVRKHSEEFFPHIVARHQSVLIRTLGNSDLRLQQNKVVNLKLPRPGVKHSDYSILFDKPLPGLWKRMSEALTE